MLHVAPHGPWKTAGAYGRIRKRLLQLVRGGEGTRAIPPTVYHRLGASLAHKWPCTLATRSGANVGSPATPGRDNGYASQGTGALTCSFVGKGARPLVTQES